MISVLTILCRLAILFRFQILCLLPGICFQEWWRFLLFQGAELLSHLPPLKARNKYGLLAYLLDMWFIKITFFVVTAFKGIGYE